MATKVDPTPARTSEPLLLCSVRPTSRIAVTYLGGCGQPRDTRPVPSLPGIDRNELLKSPRRSARSRQWLAWATLFFAVFAFWQAVPLITGTAAVQARIDAPSESTQPPRAPTVPVATSHSVSGVPLGGRRIDAMRPLDWVLAANPSGEQDLQFGSEIDPALWRLMHLAAPKGEVIAKFEAFLDRNHPLPMNHWTRRPGTQWHHDPYWTRIYPQYDLTKRDACLGQYWDDYAAEARRWAGRLPERFRIFDPALALDTREGLADLLSFVGVPEDQQQIVTGRWGALPEPDLVRERSPAQRPGPSPMDPRRCVILVPYNTQIVPQCEESLKELERRGYTVRRVAGFAAIDQGRNQLATDALLDGFEETLWIDSVGIRDVILPGDMKELMNKVTEAKKAAEANLNSRREETAAIRSQANTAKLLADNPVLMRLRELEVLEKIAANGKLNIVLGEKSLGEKGVADKVVNLL